jgi:hypothetical protein
MSATNQKASAHLQFNERDLRKSSWNSRFDRCVVEWSRRSRSFRDVRVRAALSIFEETTSCALMRRDERHFWRKWQQSKFDRKFVAKRHRTQNQSAVINY